MTFDPLAPSDAADGDAAAISPADAAAGPAAAAVSPAVAARNRLVINLLLVSAFVVILNETVMSVALPPLMVSLNVTANAVQWLTTAFLLTTAVVIPVTGFLLQRLHTRPIFIAAMSLFVFGTLVAAVSPGLGLLIVARVIQASGTAIMMPLLMTTVMTLVPPETRGKTMGNISIVMSVAPAVGPTLSGLILNYLEWRWLFILVLPIALGALSLGVRRIENVTTPRYAPLDVLSVILSAFAFGGAVYGISALGVPSAARPIPVALPLAVGAVAMIAFVLRQIALQKTNGPLLDLRTFASRTFTLSVLLMAIMMMTLFGTIILLPIYLQDVLGLSTLQTGLLLLPGGLLMGLLGPPVGRLYDRVGPTRLLVPGVIVVSLVLWAMTLLTTTTSIGAILLGHVIISIGFAFLFTPLFTVSLSSIKPELYSHGSALLGSIQQVAGATGVALFVTLMSARMAGLGALPETEALTGGIRAAFVCGAFLSLLAVGCAFFVRAPRAVRGGG
ncbi:MAG TPA: DHA2 family efflux MFS transporter permease subunit [Gammaproteobacteria bacterium]